MNENDPCSPSRVFDNVVEVRLGGVGFDDEVRVQRVDNGAGAVVDLHGHLQGQLTIEQTNTRTV